MENKNTCYKCDSVQKITEISPNGIYSTHIQCNKLDKFVCKGNVCRTKPDWCPGKQEE